MLEKLNKKLTILLVLAVSFLFSLNTARALECGGVCYTSGVCCNNVWYKGCEDSSGNLYCPVEYLGNCLTCECTSPSSCEWQPDYQICQGYYRDLVCTYTVTPSPNSKPISSACVDRDTNSILCTDTTCSYYGTWTKAGELSTSYQTAVWEYSYGNTTTFECCGDDSGEYFVTAGVGTGACCDSNTKCVDSGNVCRENADEDLVPNGCSDGIDNDCDGAIDQADQPDCCTTIIRECKAYTQQEFEFIHTKKKTPQHWKNLQIINGNYYACPIDNTDSACCENPNSCVYNGVCYDDRANLDVEGDGVNEICVASSPGQWVDDFELDCSNGIDDDFDGLIDCADTDCSGSISGRVQDTDSKNIGGARVDAVQDTTLKYTQFTQASGKYQIDDALCGDYNMIASADGYVSSTRNINLQPNEELQNIDFTLVLGSTCEDDCTYAGDNIIHRDCDGINGCEFCPVSCRFCDKQKVGDACELAQPGWVRDYIDPANCPDGCVIECAENCPEAKREVKAEVTCEKENLIKMTKVITYKGKLVKLVIVTCG